MKRNESWWIAIYLPCACAFGLLFMCVFFQVSGYWLSGGEEFIFLFPDTDEEAIKLIADRTVSAIEQAQIPHAGSHIGDYLTASIGVVTCRPGKDLSREKIVKSADVALYLGKENGRNQWRMAEPYGTMH